MALVALLSNPRASGNQAMLPRVLGPRDPAGEVTNAAAAATGLRPGVVVGPGTGDNMGAALGLGLAGAAELYLGLTNRGRSVLARDWIASGVVGVGTAGRAAATVAHRWVERLEHGDPPHELDAIQDAVAILGRSLGEPAATAARTRCAPSTPVPRTTQAHPNPLTISLLLS